MTCYAMSKPRATQPKNAKRTPIYLMVSDWPGRKVKAEPEIVPGYEYKASAPVTLGDRPDKFNFFARNEAKSGSAWLQSLNDNQRLIERMSKGVSAVAAAPRRAAPRRWTPIRWPASATRWPRSMPSATCDGRRPP